MVGELIEGGRSPETPAAITYGDPSVVSFRVLNRGRRHVVLELLTGGFYAQPQPDGSVRLSVPGFVEKWEPGLPAMPVKRSWIEAIAGRKVKVQSVEAYQVEAICGLRPSKTPGPEIVGSGLYPEHTALILTSGYQGEMKKALVEFCRRGLTSG